MDSLDFIRIIKYLPGVIIGLTVHEFSHALTAYLFGDPTSRDQGRVTLNPLKHIDLFGFIMLIVAGFGWAKPVQFNEEKLRNPARAIPSIALAGPLSNAVFAMFLSLVFFLVSKGVPVYGSDGLALWAELCLYAIYINWGLFIFNLIPIPPLDGSHILFNRLKKFPALHEALYKYGSLAFLIMLIVTSVTKINLLPIGPLINFLAHGFLSLIGYH